MRMFDKKTGEELSRAKVKEVCAVSLSPPSDCSVQSRRNPVRVLNDALHEYRTQHTTMSKDEFYEHGCYAAFMWAWQHSAQNDQIEARL